MCFIIVLAAADKYMSVLNDKRSISDALLVSNLVTRLQTERGFTAMYISSDYTNEVANISLEKAR